MGIKHNIGSELLSIFQGILNESLNLEDWILIESSDQFQTNNYCGGFDATENEFTFSFFDENRNQYWFQISLLNIQNILDGKNIKIYMERAENH